MRFVGHPFPLPLGMVFLFIGAVLFKLVELIMLKNNFFGEKDKADVRNYMSGQKKMTET